MPTVREIGESDSGVADDCAATQDTYLEQSDAVTPSTLYRDREKGDASRRNKSGYGVAEASSESFSNPPGGPPTTSPDSDGGDSSPSEFGYSLSTSDPMDLLGPGGGVDMNLPGLSDMMPRTSAGGT